MAFSIAALRKNICPDFLELLDKTRKILGRELGIDRNDVSRIGKVRYRREILDRIVGKISGAAGGKHRHG